MHYDRTTIALHWVTAGLVIVLWTIGQTADLVPHGALRYSYWSLHFLMGFIFAVVLLARIIWRAGSGKRLPPADRGVLWFAGVATHYLLYAMLIVVAGLGIANAFARGISVFALIKLPRLGSHDLGESLTDWHGFAANCLLAIAAVHACAALLHHYLKRDGVLERMLPS
jgi:cytochrome b561